MRKVLSAAILLLAVVVLVLAIPTRAATGTVLYVSDAGASGNTGASASAALNSLATAISKLPAGGGTIVVCGDLTIKDTTPVFAAKTGKVTVTGSYGGTDYNPTIKLAATANMIMQFQSEIEFNNLTFDRIGNYYTEITTGPSLTFGAGMKFLDDGAAMKTNASCMMVRLGYSDAVSSLDKKCASAFFRMESGTVNYIQGGNKWNDVGAARIEVLGSATVTDEIQCGGTNFDVDTVELSIQSGANIPVVYAGGYGKDSSHTGTVGSVTIGIGNSHVGKLYANRTDYYTITTKLNIILNNATVGGFNMSGGTIDSAAKVYLQFKNQEFFTVTNVLSWVDTLKVLENSTVLVDADYAGPTSATVTSGSTLYLSRTLNTSSDLPSNAETTSPGTIALYSGQNLPTGTPITMYYDDRLSVSKYSQVFITAKGTPTSYQVGYGISSNATKDTAVITYDSSKKQLIATGIGSAWVVLGEERIKVTVKPAPISLFLMIGQSNMAGSEGNTNESVICPEGQVYSTMGPPSSGWASTYGLDNMESLTTSTGLNFVASALAGSKAGTNRAGTTKNLSTYPINALTAPGPGKPGMDSGFAYEWNKLTGEKVWLVNAAHGGTSMGDWVTMGSTADPDGVTGAEYKQMKVLFNGVLQTMKAEIAAGHYTLEHYAYFWCQGCADRIQTTDWYLDKFGILHNRLKEDFTFDFGDGNGARKFESANLVLVRACGTDGYSSQTDTKKKDYYTYLDLEMNGVRTAQYYMANSNESTFKDVHMVCNIGDQWVWWDTAKTKETTSTFFKERYPNGFDYKIQSGTLALPTSPTVAKDSIHYNQVGYNELGRESARNAVYRMYPELAPDEEVTIKLLAWDGITDLAGKTDTEVLTERQTIVPVVYPLYRSKELVLTGAMKHDFVSLKHTQVEYGYYDIPGAQKGTVTATLGDVTVSYTLDPNPETYTYRWETVDGKLVSITGDGLTANTLKLLNGTNSGGTLANAIFRLGESVVLRHDQPWKIEWQGNLSNASGETFFLLSSSPSSNTLDAPCIMVSTHSIIVARRLDDSKAVVNRDGAPYASNYFDHLRGNATINLSSATTTYALVNEIAADGSNMVYLYINGTKKTALNKHYGINASGVDESGVTSTWLSGKDFVFSHMGAKSSGCTNVTDVTCDPNYANYKTHYDHTLNGTLKYMQIDENRLVKTEAVAATCVTDGCKEYYTDPVTGKIYADKNGTQVTTLEALKIPAHGLTIVGAQSATCTEPGNLAYWYCETCDKYYKDAGASAAYEKDEWFVPAGHTLDHYKASKATCDKDGNLAYWHCTVCGKYFKDEKATEEYAANGWIIPGGHDLLEAPANPATCTVDGYHAYWQCQRCGKHYKDAAAAEEYEENGWVIPAGHSMSDDYSENETAHWYACTKCDHTEGYEVHSYNTTNCAEEATCNACGYVKAAGSHIWSTWSVITPATCTEPGEHTRECTTCGEEETGEISAKGHELKFYPYAAPTCTMDGNNPYWWCVECTLYFSDEGETPCEEFSWILERGHKLQFVAAVAPDCENDGNIAHYKCSACDLLFADETATQPYSEEDVIDPKLWHEYEAIWTWSADGTAVELYMECINKDCDHGFEVEGIVPSEIDSKEATCTEDGYVTYKATFDGIVTVSDTKTVTIPAAHSLEEVPYQAPTTEAAGIEAHFKCSDCGARYLDAAGQQPTTEEAVTLPKLEITGKLGDADGDGYVDAYDASLIKKYSVGAIAETELNLNVLDLDGDGFVDAYDASLIQKYSVGAIEKFPVAERENTIMTQNDSVDTRNTDAYPAQKFGVGEIAMTPAEKKFAI